LSICGRLGEKRRRRHGPSPCHEPKRGGERKKGGLGKRLAIYFETDMALRGKGRRGFVTMMIRKKKKGKREQKLPHERT